MPPADPVVVFSGAMDSRSNIDGMDFFMDQSILTLFACRGTLRRDGRPYAFATRSFWVMRKNRLLVLEKEAEISGGV